MPQTFSALITKLVSKYFSRKVKFRRKFEKRYRIYMEVGTLKCLMYNY